MRYADCHLHLQDQRIEHLTGKIISSASACGVDIFIVNATCPADWPKVAALNLPENCNIKLYKFFGLHPWFADNPLYGWEDALIDYATKYGCGIGEIGLDYIMDCCNAESRRNVFKTQLQIAAEIKLPVSIHCIKAWNDLLEIMRQCELPPAMHIHGFAGSIETAEKLIDMGCWISFAPNVCFSSHKKSRQAAKMVPAEKLLSESDSPDMPGPENEFAHILRDGQGKVISQPADISNTIETIAKLRNENAAELSQKIYRNALSFVSFFPTGSHE